MLTKQEVFDLVVERLMDGTGKSFKKCKGLMDQCVYLTKDGNKCAVGIFLPENEEIQSFGGDVYDLVDEFKDHLDFPQEIIEYRNLMYDLQKVHDGKYNWEGKEFIGFNELKTVAVDHELEYKNVD